MNFTKVQVEKMNIVMLFDSTIIDYVIPYKIREIIGNNVKMHSFPDVAIIQKEEDKLQIQYSEDKLIISIFDVNSQINESANKVANSLIGLYKQILIDEVKPLSYGFNYDGEVDIKKETNASELLRDLFMPGWKELSDVLGGYITIVNPDFSLEFNDAVFSIRLSPKKDIPTHLLFHCNVQINSFTTELESDKELQKKMVISLEHFINILKCLESRVSYD